MLLKMCQTKPFLTKLYFFISALITQHHSDVNMPRNKPNKKKVQKKHSKGNLRKNRGSSSLLTRKTGVEKTISPQGL